MYGDKVERMPDGRVGTVVDWEQSTVRLSCGCCSEPGMAWVDLTWDDDDSEDTIDAEELRLK